LAEADAKSAPTAIRLPDDSELLTFLERSVAEVFTTMIGACDQVVRMESRHPVETVNERGEVELALTDAPDANVRVARESVVEFRGPFDGRFALRASEAGALAIARGLLMSGPDDQLTVEELEDALKECANMLAGWVKSQTLDPFGSFTISVPFMTNGPREIVGAAAGALALRLGDGLFVIEISRRPKPPLAVKV